jgi:small subunit ribosomal protein S1
MNNILDKLADEVDKIDESQVNASDNKEYNSSPMAELISDDLVFPQVGDVIKGRVIGITSSELYLDLGNFGTGVVIGKEIKDGMGGGKIKIGDEISATIIDLENEDGYIELSVREASHEKAWDDIESKRDTQEKVETRVIGVNKGGLMIEINGISGFLPVSQLSSKNYPRVEDGDKNKILNLLKKFQGQEMTVRIIDADRETGKLIVSEKSAQSEKDKESISKLSVGDVIEGEVSGVVDFGAFVKFIAPDKDPETASDEDRLEGLVHISELAWQLIENPRDIIKVGDKIKAQIIGIDNEKISLSIRALQKDPWSEIEKNYKIGDIVSGKVKKINHFGAFVYLDKDIHGLAHISEMSEAYPGKSLSELIKTDTDYDWKILSIEPKEHRMGLVLEINSKKKDNKSK